MENWVALQDKVTGPAYDRIKGILDTAGIKSTYDSTGRYGYLVFVLKSDIKAAQEALALNYDAQAEMEEPPEHLDLDIKVQAKNMARTYVRRGWLLVFFAFIGVIIRPRPEIDGYTMGCIILALLGLFYMMAGKIESLIDKYWH
jgi:hypothetical protein